MFHHVSVGKSLKFRGKNQRISFMNTPILLEQLLNGMASAHMQGNESGMLTEKLREKIFSSLPFLIHSSALNQSRLDVKHKVELLIS